MVLLSPTFLFTPWWVKHGSICRVFLVFSVVLNEFALTADWVPAYLTLPWWGLLWLSFHVAFSWSPWFMNSEAFWKLPDATWSESDTVSTLHFLKRLICTSHYSASVLFLIFSRLCPPTSRLEQGVSLGGRLGWTRRLLQRRGAHELWPWGWSREEAGERKSGGISYNNTRWCLLMLTHWPRWPSAGSGEVHGGRRLREGRASGAVRQERRHCPANQRRRGGTVVSISNAYHDGERWFHASQYIPILQAFFNIIQGKLWRE